MSFLRYEDEGGNDVYVTFDVTETEGHEGTALVTEHPIETGSNVTDHVRAENDILTLDIIITNTPLTPRIPLALQEKDVVPFGFDAGLGLVTTASVFVASPRRRVGGPNLFIEGSPPQSIRDIVPFAGVAQSFVDIGPIAGPALSAIQNVEVIPGVNPAWEEPEFVDQAGSDREFQVLQYDEPFDRVRSVSDLLQKLRRTGTIVEVTTSIRVYSNMVFESIGIQRDSQSGSAMRGTIQLKQIRTVSSQTVEVTDALEPRGQKRAARGKQEPADSSPEESKKLISTFAEVGPFQSF